MIWYVIPAREGSKGWRHKNRELFFETATKIPTRYNDNVIVTTDDEEIKSYAKMFGFRIHNRSAKTSDDAASMKEALLECKKDMGIKDDDVIVLLYLTYPQRFFSMVEETLDFFYKTFAKSMLCKKEVKSNPFLCMFTDGIKGKQIIKHDLYRRQDYPAVFEISHFIGIFEAGEIEKLNKNLYNDETVFFQIRDFVDVDKESDYRGIK